MTPHLLLLDLDGTTTQGYSWNRLNVAMGVPQELNTHYYHSYYRGEITYTEWLNALVDIYREKGIATKHRIHNVLRSYRLYPGARTAIRCARAKGHEVAIISAAIDTFVQAVAKDLSIKHFAFNSTLEYDRQGRLLRATNSGEEAEVKLEQAKSIASKLGFGLDRCISVGDSLNDRILFQHTRGVTFDRCDCLHDYCWKRIKDWRGFVPLLNSI